MTATILLLGNQQGEPKQKRGPFGLRFRFGSPAGLVKKKTARAVFFKRSATKQGDGEGGYAPDNHRLCASQGREAEPATEI